MSTDRPTYINKKAFLALHWLEISSSRIGTRKGAGSIFLLPTGCGRVEAVLHLRVIAYREAHSSDRS